MDVYLVNLRDQQVRPTINSGNGPETLPLEARASSNDFPEEQLTQYTRDLADNGWIQIKPSV